MSDRKWNLRMSCSYQGGKNSIASCQVEILGDDGAWKPLAIANDSPGFLIFVYSLLTCQHMYMYVNAAERGLLLASSQGTMELVATQGWMLTDLRVAFHGQLRSGTPSEADIADIEKRMNQCPVSRNIHTSGVHETRLTLSA